MLKALWYYENKKMSELTGKGATQSAQLKMTSLDMPLEQPPREIPQLKCRGSNTKSFIKSSTADKTAT